MIRHIAFLAVVLLAVLTSASGVYSYEGRQPLIVKAVEKPGFVRLFFYCPQPVEFAPALNGSNLTVTFDRGFEPDLGDIQSRFSQYFSATSWDASGKTATFTLTSPNYGFRKFVGEKFIGIDLFPQAAKKAEAAPEETAPKPKVTAEAPKPKPQELAKQVVPEQTPVVLPSPVEAAAKPDAELVRKFEPAAESVDEVDPEDVIAQMLGSDKPAQAQKPTLIRKFEPMAELKEDTVETAEAAAAPETTAAPAVTEAVKETLTVAAPVATAETAKATEPLPATDAKADAEAETTPAVEPAAAQTAAADTPEPAAEAAQADDATPTAEIAQAETATEAKPDTTETETDRPDETISTAALSADTPTADSEKPAIAEEQSSVDEFGPAAPSSVPKEVGTSVDAFKGMPMLAKLSFPWLDEVGAAVFVRGDYLWVVFDAYQKIDVDGLKETNGQFFSSAEQIDNKYYTILRFKMDQALNALAYRVGNNWVIGITDKKVLPETEPLVDVNVSQLHGSKILINSQATIKPLRLLDPVVGDEMIVLPSLQENTGFRRPRFYTDFVLLKTAQGSSVELISDGVTLDVVKRGVEIAGPTNKLAGSAQSSLRELQEREREAQERAERLKGKAGDITLIKFNTWRIGDDKSFIKDLEELQWNITEADWSKKSEPRLELARFYFAHKLYEEAIAVLATLKAFDEPFSDTSDFKILEAVTFFRAGKYNEASDIFNLINFKKLDEKSRKELNFWKAATAIELGDQIKIDKFISTNPVEERKGDESEANDEVANTRLMFDTSSRLLKIIRKMDPDFVNADEIQKLESTARFVTDHYYESIRRFEESDLYRSGDAFQAEEGQLWWSTSERRRVEEDTMDFIKGIDVFLKYYPEDVYNDFALVALEERLKKNDLVVAEEILGSFKPEERPQAKNSTTFLKGLFSAKDEEDAKAIEVWKSLETEVNDPYNRARSTFAMTVFQLRKQEITVKTAIERLNGLRSLWRGGVLEFEILKMLGEFYMDEKRYMEGFKVWRSAISAFPGSDEALLIAKKMSDKFVQIFSQGDADGITKLDALTLYYEFRELTPIGKLGDEMISRLVDRLIEVDLLERAAALLTHQVRFRLVGDERNAAAMKLVRVHLMNHNPQAAFDVLNATYSEDVSEELATERKYLSAAALMEQGKSNKVLALLKGDDTHRASFLRADVFWRNKVWRKVVEELEAPFREIRREDKTLSSDETDQLLRIAVAYALTGQRKKLEVLFEDFSNLIPFEDRKAVFTFVATDRGPVDFRDLEQTVEFQDMDSFLKSYMKSADVASQ